MCRFYFALTLLLANIAVAFAQPQYKKIDEAHIGIMVPDGISFFDSHTARSLYGAQGEDSSALQNLVGVITSDNPDAEAPPLSAVGHTLCRRHNHWRGDAFRLYFPRQNCFTF